MTYTVVHPLDDEPEDKQDVGEPFNHWGLAAFRVYLMLLALGVGYRLVFH
jgi:hypothetical protein